MYRIVVFILTVFGIGLLIIFLIAKFTNPRTLIQNLSNSTPKVNQISSNLIKPLNINNDKVKIFANLKGGKPRVLAFDPNGVLFVSMPEKGNIEALIDSDKNGQTDEVKTVVSGLNKPHGIAFNGGYLYVGETDKVVRYKYNSSVLKADAKEVLYSIPGGGRHYTRTLKIKENKLYTSVGSSCDTCLDDVYRASILVSDLDGKNLKEFARGLRNTVFFAFDKDGNMWGADMGRDFLGDSLPPEEINLIEESGDYGWPYCYGDKIRDTKFMNGEKMDYCKNTKSPIFEMPAHIAPLGIVFDPQGNLLIAQHGSWNSTIPVGYKIVKLLKNGNKITGIEDYLVGFISDDKVLGRPVDLIFDNKDNLYISDDKAGLIYKVLY